MSIKTVILAPIFALVALSAAAGSYSTDTSDNDYSSDSGKNSQKVVMKVETNVGHVFANSEGKTLYTFTKDNASKSNCYGGCASNWPPFYAKKDAKEWGAFTVISRNDGTYQWAYQEAPLYFWVGDNKKGDVNGHGIQSVWYVAEAM